MTYYIVQAKREFTFRKEFTRLKDANDCIDYYRRTFGESCAGIFEIIRQEIIGTNQAKNLTDKRKRTKEEKTMLANTLNKYK